MPAETWSQNLTQARKRRCQGGQIEKTLDWALGDQSLGTIASTSCYLGKASVSEGPFPGLHQPSRPTFLGSEKFPEIDHDFLCFLEVGKGELDKSRASNGSLDAKNSSRVPGVPGGKAEEAREKLRPKMKIYTRLLHLSSDIVYRIYSLFGSVFRV